MKKWSQKKVKMVRVTLHPDREETMQETIARYTNEEYIWYDVADRGVRGYPGK